MQIVGDTIIINTLYSRDITGRRPTTYADNRQIGNIAHTTLHGGSTSYHSQTTAYGDGYHVRIFFPLHNETRIFSISQDEYEQIKAYKKSIEKEVACETCEKWDTEQTKCQIGWSTETCKPLKCAHFELAPPPVVSRHITNAIMELQI